MESTLGFWTTMGIIVVVAFIACWIVAFFGEKEDGYLGGILHAIIIMVIIAGTVAICIGMTLGKYVF